MKVKQVCIRGSAWYAWYSDGRYARCAYRGRFTPGYRFDLVGFRCCFSPFFVKINKERLEK